MKKSYLTALLLPLLLTACTAAQPPELQTETTPPAESAAQTETVTPTETEMPETQPSSEAPPASEAKPVSAGAEQYAGEQHIFDECGVLDAAALAHYNQYLDDLANSRLLCTAVVVTDALNGEEPEAFAQRYYRDHYGKASGFLVLVNNDTLRDVIYREGVCEVYMADTALPLAQATPHMVEGDFAGALEILLPLGEHVPEKVFDRSGTLSQEQFEMLLDAAEDSERCVLLTGRVPDPEEEETPEEAFAAYAEDIRGRLQAEMLLVLDVTENRCVIAGEPPEELVSRIETIWDEQGLSAAVLYYYGKLETEDETEETAEEA